MSVVLRKKNKVEEKQSETKKQEENNTSVKKKYKIEEIFSVGDIISITNRSGVTYIGTYKGKSEGMLYLLDVEILGNKYKVKAPWVLIEKMTVSHVHLGNVEISLREEV